MRTLNAMIATCQSTWLATSSKKYASAYASLVSSRIW